MFVDYSGLQRFSSINRCFAHRFIQLLEYEDLDTLEERLKFLKSLEKDEVCIQRLEITDFADHSDVMDYLFKLSLSVKQMQEVSEVIRRCPTTYSVEIFNANEISVDIGDVVAWAGMFLRNTYDSIRKALYDDIKQIIVDLKPELNNSSFQDWHLLQRYLFYGWCEEVPKFMEPRTNIIIIPMNFPEIFVNNVNKNGFMSATSDITFYTFEVENGDYNSLANFNIDSLVRRPIKDKISTIWKDGDEKDYIGTVWEPTKENNIHSNNISENATTQPNFLTLFHECDSGLEPNTIVDGADNSFYMVQHDKERRHHRKYERDSSSPASDGGSAESESNSHSDKDGSLYDIFSPLSSNELPTALTPPNNASDSSPVQGKNYNYMANLEREEKSKDYALLPPPPSFLPCYSDFENSSLYNQKQGFRYKLRQLFSSSSSSLHSRSKRQSSGDKSLTGFDTIGSWADFQSSNWDDLSTKKFFRYKMRKWKKNYQYYKEVAKQCIEDFHDNTSYN
ncbi:hypothetical protein ZYGR_0P02100 [Zygosaccharomyces rouxii]|uniref:ZYRO0E05302p n=2 Tax=Zygosaccharomyces rouxii TaxID=4956 RepID=C5E4E6_ZYGRC|nr:uncharacterized protein ZYRO0E05302g [Zygosaccharomyces rouxii]KAH9198235.1 hypothetical protein LQ764DRAFT_214735 [Zygosaccharomyces rouxii]GAV49566.1 hypothetical protein ZYGR_0P02100 [Zygosaccharomyces rouxii]CAR30907.1 ZYRO0E05302p [Zygosaccharomyces rouxii]